MQHLPVMLREVLEYIGLQEGGVYVDATVGPGGHSEELLKGIGPEGLLICIDRDRETLLKAEARLQDNRCRFVHSRFSRLADAVRAEGVQEVQGVLMDFGVSMLQLKDAERGFSFTSEEALDMRMDRTESVSAADAVNQWPEEELARVIYEYGQEWRSRRVAAAIIRARRKSRIETCKELAGIVASAIGRGGRTHPATKTFQGLRIAVNREMEEIDAGLEGAVDILAPGGRLVTIAYHSLEDGKAKRFLKEESRQGRVLLITKKPLVPSREEIRENPSARSAKLRVAEAI